MRILYIITLTVSLLIFLATGIASVLQVSDSAFSNTLLTMLTAISGAISLVVAVVTLRVSLSGGGINQSITPKEYVAQLRLEFQNQDRNNIFVPLPIQEQIRPTFQGFDLHKNINYYDVREFKSVNDILRVYKKFVLIGDPGSGKSVILRRIGLLLIDRYFKYNSNYEKSAYMPFFINLGDSDNPSDPQELIKHWWKKNGLAIDPEPLIKGGSLFLLLDGLNEMPDGFGKDSLRYRAKELRYFLSEEYKGPVIVTCRVADYNESLQLRLPDVKIAKLGAKEIKIFAEKQLKSKYLDFIDVLLERRERLALSTNAYALAMMIALFASQNYKFPNNRQELYDRYILKRYEDNLKEKQGRSKVRSPLDTLRQSWSVLAYEMMIAGHSNNVTRKWAEKQTKVGVKRFLPFIKNLSIVDALNLGLLIEDVDTSKIRFYHQTLFEHFALPFINLSDGNIYDRLKLIQRLENLGEIALPALPTLTVMFLEQSDNYDLYNACRAAVINIALETGTPKGVQYVLSVMLETAIRLHTIIQTGDAEDLRILLAESLKNDFETALAKALTDVVVANRKEDLIYALGKLGRRYKDETDNLAAQLSDLSSLEKETVTTTQLSHQAREFAEWLAKTNIETLQEARAFLDTLDRPTNYNKANTQKLIIVLAELRALMEGQPLTISSDTLTNILQDHKALKTEILVAARELSGI